jgi:hypothetical protein
MSCWLFCYGLGYGSFTQLFRLEFSPQLSRDAAEVYQGQ